MTPSMCSSSLPQGVDGAHVLPVAPEAVDGHFLPGAQHGGGAVPEEGGELGIAVVAQNLKVGPEAVVPPKAMITRNVKGGAVCRMFSR